MNPFTTGRAQVRWLFCLSTILLFQNFSISQLSIEWDKTFGGIGWEELNGTVLTDDFGYLFCGTTFSNQSFDVGEPNRGVGDFWVVKTDSAGTLLWEHRYGGSDWDRLWTAIECSDGGYLLGGESNSNAGNGQNEKSEDSRGGHDYWIVKIDSEGIYEWDKTIGGTGQDTLFGLAEVADGYVLSGFSNSPPDPSTEKSAPNRGKADYWVVKISKHDRNVMWDRTFGGDERDQLFVMKPCVNGGFVLGGSSESQQNTGNKNSPLYGLNDMWIVKIDANGNLEWERTFGGDGEETIQDILITSDNQYILCGQTSSLPGTGVHKTSQHYGHWDYYVVKISENGDYVWDRSYGGEGTDLAYAMVENEIGNILISGVSSSLPNTGGGNKTAELIGGGANDFWMVYVNASGEEVIWDMTFGGNSIDSPPELHHAHNGGYVFGGHSSSNLSETKSENSKGLNDFFVIKTNCPISLDLPDITNHCKETPIQVDATIEDCVNCQYYWDDGFVGPIRDIPNDNINATYEVTAFHEDGCDITESFEVHLVASPEELILDHLSISCFGEADGAISLIDIEGGSAPYLFKMNGLEFSEPTDFYNLPPGDYLIEVIDSNACSHDTIISLTQPQEPIVSLPPDLTIDWGDSVQIQALVTPNVTSFEWGNPSIITCKNCLEPYAFPLTTSTLNIQVEDENGCMTSDEMTIYVVKNLAVYIPNAFSPNGDGQNDFFAIYSNNSVRQVLDLKIYDRWGQLMFENEDFPPNTEPQGWDGKFLGKFMKPNVYVYWVEVEFIDGTTQFFEGDIHLIR